MSEERLTRMQRWLTCGAIFATLSIGHALQSDYGSLLFWIAFLSPFAIGAAIMSRLKLRARQAPVSQEWPPFAGAAKAAIGLRDRWWASAGQIARAWLISGVTLGCVEFALYRDLRTATFAAVTFPAIVLAASWWWHQRTADGRALPISGWYADPASRHQQRYWDGEGWTRFVLDAGTPSVDPPM